MSRQARTVLGMAGLLLGLFFYIGAVGWLGAWLGPMPLLATVLFYAFFGIAWIFPGRLILKWIGRAPGEPG